MFYKPSYILKDHKQTQSKIQFCPEVVWSEKWCVLDTDCRVSDTLTNRKNSFLHSRRFYMKISTLHTWDIVKQYRKYTVSILIQHWLTLTEFGQETTQTEAESEKACCAVAVSRVVNSPSQSEHLCSQTEVTVTRQTGLSLALGSSPESLWTQQSPSGADQSTHTDGGLRGWTVVQSFCSMNMIC